LWGSEPVCRVSLRHVRTADSKADAWRRAGEDRPQSAHEEEALLTRRSSRRALVSAIAALLSLATAAQAQAALEWHAGSIEQSYVGNCLFDAETGIIANAEFQSDPVRLPRTGDVFYVRTIPGRVGNGCGIGMSAHVEIVLPPGVATAVSPAHPVRCNSMDIDSGAVTPVAGCPQAAQQGIYGPAFDQNTGGSIAPWQIAYGQALVIEIPLRSSRRLAGTSPSCGRTEGQPPCAGDRSGNTAQFAEKIIDGWASPWLSPYVALFVQDAGAGGPPGKGGLIASAPKSVRIARLVHGLTIKVRVARARSRVTAKLSTQRGLRVSAGARTRLIVSETVRRAKAGTLKLRLKPSRRLGRALRHVRTLSTTLRVRVKPPAARALTAQMHILLKR
jgi:hypothetical protein